MNLPTDTELEKRADEIVYEHFRFKYGFTQEAIDVLKHATLEDLKIERESYSLLMELVTDEEDLGTHTQRCPALFGKDCICGVPAHLATLRKRLGIPDTR